MNLPNFINFEPFNALRRKMHTDRLGKFRLPPPSAAAEPEAAAVPPTKKPTRRRKKG